MGFLYNLLLDNPYVPWVIALVVILVVYQKFGHMLRVRLPGGGLSKDELFGKLLGPRWAEAQVDRQVSRFKKQGNFLAAGKTLEDANRLQEAADAYLEGQEYWAAAATNERIGRSEKAAELYLQAGDFKKAAQLLIDAGKPGRAAVLFQEKGNNLEAARLYGLAGVWDKAADLYSKSGYPLRAAEAFEKTGEFIKAAECYEKHFMENVSFSTTFSSTAPSTDQKSALLSGRLYEKGGDLKRAFQVYSKGSYFKEAAAAGAALGEFEKAAELFMRPETRRTRPRPSTRRATSCARPRCGAKSRSRPTGPRMRRPSSCKARTTCARLSSTSRWGSWPRLRRPTRPERAGPQPLRSTCVPVSRKRPPTGTRGPRISRPRPSSTKRRATTQRPSSTTAVPVSPSKAARPRSRRETARRRSPSCSEWGLRTRTIGPPPSSSPDSSSRHACRRLPSSACKRPSEPSPCRLRTSTSTIGSRSRTKPRATSARRSASTRRSNPRTFSSGMSSAGSPALRPAVFPRPPPTAPIAAPSAAPASPPAAAPPTAPAPAKKAARFAPREEIGRGRLGTVFRAEDTVDGRSVALRVLPAELLAGGGILQALVSDLKAAAQLSHPNLVKVLGLVDLSGQRCLVSELVPGKNLAEPLQSGRRMAFPQVHGLGRVLAQTLSFVHSKGMVHGSIQPSNVMVASGVLKIADFGLARIAGAPSAPENYRAPENVQDAQDDLYAMAAVLYHLLTGSHPKQQAQGVGLPLPSKLAPGVPEAMDKLLLRCLHPRREVRFASADEVMAELKNMVKIG